MLEMTAGARPTSILIFTHITFQDCVFVARGAIQQVTAISTEHERSDCSHYYHTEISHSLCSVVMLGRDVMSAPEYGELRRETFEGLIRNYRTFHSGIKGRKP